MLPLKVIPVAVAEPLSSHLRRELSNHPAEVEAIARSVPDAIEGLRATRDQPRLLIVHVRSQSDLTELKRLSGTFAQWPILALVESAAGPGMLLGANRRGAWQVVPAPLDSADFQEALGTIGMHFGCANTHARVVAVSGTTGGCGATSLAINLAHEYAVRHNRQTILAELALQMGVAATYLDVQPRVTVPDLLRDVDRVDAHLLQQAVINIADKLDLLAGPPLPRPPQAIGPRDLLQLLDFAQRLAEVLVLDVPCTFNDLQFEVLNAANTVVLVGLQTIPSVRSLKLVCETLGANRIESALTVVVNRYDPTRDGFTTEQLKELLGVSRVLGVADDPAGMTAAINHGRPLRVVAPNSPALADVASTAAALLGVQAPPGSRVTSSGFFTRLMGAFKR